MSPSRALAFDVLLAVERGGYASDLLAARSGPLDSRDAGLASEIVFGVLRYRAQLDYLIQRHAGTRLDPEVRLTLRIGAYQLRYLERIPRHAAVSESVDLVKRARKRSAAPLVNAVLRRITREPVSWPDRETALSHPEWLLARWEAEYGRETAEAIARANLRPPETYVRATEPSAQLEPTNVPGCYRLIAGPAEGFRIQDIGSQTIVPLLDLRPGQRFLDLCAAPGNKTAQALETGVRAVACDLHPHRLKRLRELGIPLLVLNGTEPLPFGAQFDRILVDAPCSGTGTLARNPEIKWRLRPADLADLHQRQVALLRNALAVLRPGGILVYSTCSLEAEENEEVVAEVACLPGHYPGPESSQACGTGRSACPDMPNGLSHEDRGSEGPAGSDAPGDTEPVPVRGGGGPPGAMPVPVVAQIHRRIPGRDPGDGFFAAVIKLEQPAND